MRKKENFAAMFPQVISETGDYQACSSSREQNKQKLARFHVLLSVSEKT
jgi:hypothetical protein